MFVRSIVVSHAFVHDTVRSARCSFIHKYRGQIEYYLDTMNESGSLVTNTAIDGMNFFFKSFLESKMLKIPSKIFIRIFTRF